MPSADKTKKDGNIMNQINKKIQYRLPDGATVCFSRYKFKTAIYNAITASGKKTSQQVFLEEMADGSAFQPTGLDFGSAVAGDVKLVFPA